MRRETKDFLYSICVQIIVVTAIVQPSDVPWFEGVLPSSVLPAWLVSGLAVAWWYALAWNITSGLELFVWSRIFGGGADGKPRQRKLLTDIINIIIYIAATAIIAVHVFKQPVTGLFATSGIVAIVLGMALQNTLGDLFAGLALNFERPYKAGDWITLDGNIQGFVLVTNWRSTHLRTRTADEIVVPNGTVAKSRLTVHSRPTNNHLTNIELPLKYGFDEAAVEALLKTSASKVNGVLADPAPIVLLHEMKYPVATWRLYFYIDDFARLVVIKGQVAREVYAAFRQSDLSRFLPNDIEEG